MSYPEEYDIERCKTECILSIPHDGECILPVGARRKQWRTETIDPPRGFSANGPIPTDAELFEQKVNAVYAAAEELLLKKHRDYGPKNISLSPGGPLNGLRVRMWDKLARINNLIDSGAEPENESLLDSFKDIANYGLIAVLVLQGDWPE